MPFWGGCKEGLAKKRYFISPTLLCLQAWMDAFEKAKNAKKEIDSTSSSAAVVALQKQQPVASGGKK